ncbi:endonuclease/exonuclease/phosphatase family protein [Prevotella sp. KH2C16]|uniref:endonuclease/exonuclease/phosphatase family protein n=1 Tax=Prevotella sp. KH2C16 TaxID=1855325 RepID=UPI0008F3C37C|nr:endonuclease/exonuclease/phosphatase family protein [Prevotella sp. KH2C16]SFF92640.1 Endonuclease/Exonuclease/phosphatase family protein [Prevotella sp. KH2C16]
MSFAVLLVSFFTFIELNCENLFDCEHDSLKQDQEFLPDSWRHWNHYRYWQKLNHIGQEIIACGEQDGGWQLPDMVALCEVENDSVVVDLTKKSLLRKAGYEYVMTNSPDVRGIDVALLYSPMSFRLINHHSVQVTPLKNMRPTRDILYASGLVITGDTLHVFVVHAPSRSDGVKATQPHRMQVARRLLEAVDSLRALSPAARILIAGDFNDSYSDMSIQLLLSHQLVDVSREARGTNGAKATYRYQGEWDSIDHILCSENLQDSLLRCRIGDFPFLLEADDKYGGIRPKRNYYGAHWKNGFSDHLPLIARFCQ